MKRLLLLVVLIAVLIPSAQATIIVQTVAAGAGTHSFVAKSQVNADASSPVVHNHTPVSTATGIVISIVYQTAETRTGGSPTIGGVTATQAETVIGGGGSEETKVEIWYRVAAFDGSLVAISIPNTGSASLHVEAVSFTASSGYDSAYDDSGSDSYSVASVTTESVPTVTTTVASDFIYARLGCGEDATTSITEDETLTYENDHGNYSSSGQYLVMAGTGAQAMRWSFTDDHASIAVAFKVVAQ